MAEISGLTFDEVRERISRGEVNSTTQNESRSYFQILAKNICTGFNLILFILGAAFLIIGFIEPSEMKTSVTNSISATGIIIVNVIIATIQEWKAKRRLDKIALLLRPKVQIIRDGQVAIMDQKEIVKDDIIKLSAGEQALVDGYLVHQEYLEMDESLLTGESKTVRKKDGERVYSGSYCVAGDGYYKVDAFGDNSFAAQIVSTAKKQVTKKTPLQIETTTITMILMAIALLFSLVATIVSLIFGNSIGRIAEQIAVILDIVPIALFLLIVITYMIAAIRMADSGVLLQNSSSVESISHVDTVCMDKTGTITTNKLKFNEVKMLSDTDVDEPIRMYVGSVGGKNRTIDALEGYYGGVQKEVVDEIRFTSERKFSAVKLDDNGKVRSFYLGALTTLGPHMNGFEEISSMVREYSDNGLRTVLFGESDASEDYSADGFEVPALKPIALFAIEDEVRSDCRHTIDVFLENGMDLKVISGDDPRTVDALFTIAKIPGERKVISGEELAKLEGQSLTDAILETNIFGRMKPDQKETVIDILRANGRYVAMVGDGVNDVKSLKKANVGVALESGSGAARGVADIVLVKDNFAALPEAIVEGKRTVSGMRDILKFYISRNFTLAILIALTLITLGNLPLNPRQNVFYAFLSVGVGAFFMAIWAKPSDNKEMILPAVLRFAIPTAITVSLSALAIFAVFEILVNHGVLVYDGFDAQRIGSGMIVLFLTFAGIMQLLVVSPYFKIFSIDGVVYKDIKPVVLTVLLVLGAFAAYNVDFLLEVTMMNIPHYELWLQFLMFGLACAWLVVQHIVLKHFRLKWLDVFVEKWYMKSFYRVSEKERDSEVKL